MPKLDQRIERLERARPAASDEKSSTLDLSALSTATLKELMSARRDDRSIDLDKLSDAALAELEAACILQRSLNDEDA